ALTDVLIRLAKQALKSLLPSRTYRNMREALLGEESPALDWKYFCSLRRLRPIRPDSGARVGLGIGRYYIDNFIARHAADIQGRVLEVADRRYTTRHGGSRVSQSDVLHVKPGNPDATIVADLTSADHIPSDAFDCIILTQTLQYIWDSRAAVRTIKRILKPGGVLLATAPGIAQITRYDMEQWGEYWRFTTLSAQRLFREYFQDDSVTVQSYGNVLATIARLHGILASELRPEELDYHDPDYDVIISIRAVKQGGT
ncbi:MAG: methyltransferase domain-containing protein, partial [Nitrospiraceae bacterium]